MIHRTAGVQDDVVANLCSGVDRHTGTNHHSLAQTYVWSQYRIRMHGIDKSLPSLPGRVKHTGSDDVVPHRYDNGIVFKLRQLTDLSQDRQTHDHCTCDGRVIVQKAHGLAISPHLFGSEQYIGHHLGMAPCS
jgi:hypothetical protein